MINLNFSQQKYSANMVNFQGGPVDLIFLKRSLNNSSKAQAILHKFQYDVYDVNKENLKLIEDALPEAKSGNYYLTKTVEYMQKTLGITPSK